MCCAPLGLNCARCSLRNRCTNSLSWADETSGSQACVLRVCGVAWRASMAWSRARHSSSRDCRGSREMRGLSCGRVDGVTMTRSRFDAIDANLKFRKVQKQTLSHGP